MLAGRPMSYTQSLADSLFTRGRTKGAFFTKSMTEFLPAGGSPRFCNVRLIVLSRETKGAFLQSQ